MHNSLKRPLLPNLFYRLASLLTIITYTTSPVISQTVEQRPNIIFIMADDLGIGDLGCYGQEKIQTPHLDALARSGVKFTNAYAGSSVCAPSRCSLLTGKHNGRNRVRDNVPHGVFL
ncbi:MAG: sulfatase-like hydrolase/transferase, partial [Spirosomataceae bacterium]